MCVWFGMHFSHSKNAHLLNFCLQLKAKDLVITRIIVVVLVLVVVILVVLVFVVLVVVVVVVVVLGLFV